MENQLLHESKDREVNIVLSPSSYRPLSHDEYKYYICANARCCAAPVSFLGDWWVCSRCLRKIELIKNLSVGSAIFVVFETMPRHFYHALSFWVEQWCGESLDVHIDWIEEVI